MLGQPHTCALRQHSPVCLWLPPRHREHGGSSQDGQEEEGWQPGPLSFPEAASPPLLGRLFLHYQLTIGGEEGRHFLWAEREGTLHPKAESKEHAHRQASAARSWRCLLLFPGVGDAVRPRCAGAPAAAVLPTRSWRGSQELAVSTLGRDCQSKRDVTLLMNCMVFYMH